MLQEVSVDVGIGNGCGRPLGKDIESLVFLQASHAYKNLSKEAYSFGQKTLVKEEQVSFLVTRWAPVTEVCNF